MTWLELGIIGTALGASINIIDKIIIERYYKDIWTYPFFMAFFLGIYSLILFSVRFSLRLLHFPAFPTALIIFLPGLIHYLTATLNTKAYMLANASTVSAINQVRPIFVLIWGTIVFGDFFLPVNYIGILLIVFCTIILSLERSASQQEKNKNFFQLNPAYLYVLIAAFISSISDLIIKFSLSDMAFWDVFALSRVTLLIPCTITFLHPKSGKKIINSVKKTGIKFLYIVGLVEIGAMVGLLLLVLAFDRGSMALVSSTQATGPLFVLIFTLLLNKKRPGIVPSHSAEI